jgi:hypothetical protein
MRGVAPTTEGNPVVRLLNMVMRNDGVVYKRFAFDATALTGTVRNHINCQLQEIVTGDPGTGDHYLVVKKTDGVYFYQDGEAGAGTEITNNAAWDQSAWAAGTVAADERGSFAIHNRELYYSDTITIFAWDGRAAAGARAPGVPSLAGVQYPSMPSNVSFFGPGDGCIEDYHPFPGATVNVLETDPFITLAAGCTPGEKTLNTGFAFSYYDHKRDIYGRRSEVHALPYIFGPPDPNQSDAYLTDERCQFSKTIRLPSLPAGYTTSDLSIAVWFTLGQNIIANPDVFAIQGPFFELNNYYPCMSARMSSTLFLEAIVEGTTGQKAFTKDNQTLFQSGRYVDTFARPVPSRHMAILNSGTAIYFFPRQTERTPFGDMPGQDVRQQAEYSVKHPEQIGRDTETHRETRSQLPTLKGVPELVISDGDRQLLLTRLSIYQIGFSGQVVLNEIVAGRGLRGRNVADSAVGTLWMADEGVVWMRGGSMVLLDQKLGFGEWFSRKTDDERSRVVIGAADGVNQILIMGTDVINTASGSDAEYHALVFDHEEDFVSEFKPNSIAEPTYAAHFRGNTGSQLYVWGWGRYPSADGNRDKTNNSEIICWLNDEVDRPKNLGIVVIDFPDCGAVNDTDAPASTDVDVTIQSFEHARQLRETSGANEFITESRTETVTVTGNGRYMLASFSGMRGRIFRIRMFPSDGASAETAVWGVEKLRVNYEFDEDSDARSR